MPIILSLIPSQRPQPRRQPPLAASTELPPSPASPILASPPSRQLEPHPQPVASTLSSSTDSRPLRAPVVHPSSPREPSSSSANLPLGPSSLHPSAKTPPDAVDFPLLSPSSFAVAVAVVSPAVARSSPDLVAQPLRLAPSLSTLSNSED
ncbi:LOB domain-containing protein [Psidium guajava]|nr:LOB domain-containing protein [Psidium guajava]